MIAVIADDFTGAAEIGGLGLSYGLKVAIDTGEVRNADVDLLVIATDLRSLGPEEAARESAKITRELLALNPEFIYKKIDSVMRGNIGVELEAQMEASNKKRALVIPANPSLKRTVKDGIYYVDNKPLTESIFAGDHSFDTSSSNVVEIIKNQGIEQVISVSLLDELPETGFFIGNTLDKDDLKNWAAKINNSLALAGASGFFGAILGEKTHNPVAYNDSPLDIKSKNLFISGSNFPDSKQAVWSAKQNGYCVSEMPDEIYYNRKFDASLIDQWSSEIIQSYDTRNQVIVSVPQKPNDQSINSMQVREIIGSLAEKILDKVSINELLIEGGATAHAIVDALNIDTFFPIQSLAQGVTRMRVGNKKGMSLTMKPGSYAWPKSIWNFSN